jgi:hypothetical protein
LVAAVLDRHESNQSRNKTPTCTGWRFRFESSVLSTRAGRRTGAAGPPTYGQMSGRRAILEQLAQLVAQL